MRQIGQRLADGQKLNDAKSSLGEALGAIAINAADVAGKTTATVISAPFSGIDKPQTHETGDAKPLVQ